MRYTIFVPSIHCSNPGPIWLYQRRDPILSLSFISVGTPPHTHTYILFSLLILVEMDNRNGHNMCQNQTFAFHSSTQLLLIEEHSLVPSFVYKKAEVALEKEGSICVWPLCSCEIWRLGKETLLPVTGYDLCISDSSALSTCYFCQRLIPSYLQILTKAQGYKMGFLQL